jgi:hypothetical protein
MTGSKRVSLCLGSDLARAVTHVIQPEEYDELPELTGGMLAAGRVNGGSDAESDVARDHEI